MENKNVFSTLGEYVRGVLDTNKDGVISVKDFVALFPNFAIMIAVLFVDAAVAVAEYRVWDVGYEITDDPYKAVGFVLVSAVPFYLGQIFWLYPRATFWQKSIAVLMVAASLYTSWTFGTADLTLSYDIEELIGMVVNLTAIYIVAGLVYVLIDPGIKAHRLKVQARAAAEQEKEFQQITRDVLGELRITMQTQKQTEQEFGADAVIAQLDRLRGKKAVAQPALPAQAFASTVKTPELKDTSENPQKRD